MRWRNLLIVLGVVLLGVVFYFDKSIISFISQIRNVYLDRFFWGMSMVIIEILIFIFVSGLFIWKKSKRKWVFPLWGGFAISGVISFLLKVSIQRMRPFQKLLISTPSFLERNSYLVWNYSFPSFHAMFVFCSIPILSKEFPKLKVWFWILGVFIGASRVYFGVHYLSDVLVGGIIGLLIGHLMIHLEKDVGFGERIYKDYFVKA